MTANLGLVAQPVCPVGIFRTSHAVVQKVTAACPVLLCQQSLCRCHMRGKPDRLLCCRARALLVTGMKCGCWRLPSQYCTVQYTGSAGRVPYLAPASKPEVINTHFTLHCCMSSPKPDHHDSSPLGCSPPLKVRIGDNTNQADTQAAAPTPAVPVLCVQEQQAARAQSPSHQGRKQWALTAPAQHLWL